MRFIRTKYKQRFLELNQKAKVFFTFPQEKRSGEYTNSTNFVKCRDFLGDALHAIHHQIDSPRIYGFTFHGKGYALPEEESTLIIHSEDVDISLHADLLSDFEIMNGWAPTSFTKLDPGKEYGYYYLVSGDRRWTSSLAYISLWTFLIRQLYWAKDEKDIVSLLSDISRDEETGLDGKYADALLETTFPLELLLSQYAEVTKDANIYGNADLDEVLTNQDMLHEGSGILTFMEKIKTGNTQCKTHMKYLENVQNLIKKGTTQPITAPHAE